MFNLEIEFQSVPNVINTPARLEKEIKVTEHLKTFSGQFKSFNEFAKWIFTEHAAYSVGKRMFDVKKEVLSTY